MTAAALPGRAGAAPGAPRADDGQADTAPLEVGLDLMATIGLAAYSLAVAVGFSRVFPDRAFLGDLALIILVGHGSSYVMRRLRLPVLVAVPTMLVVLTWMVAWIYYGETLTGVFPLAETWEQVRVDFRAAAEEFQTATAPVPYAGGWAFLAGAATAMAVWLADTFAFRAQARGESLVPGAVLFVFIAALGVDEDRVACSLAVVGAGLFALALLRQRLDRRPRTVLGRPIHPLAITVPAAVVAAAVVMGGTWVLGPLLPGAQDEPLFDTQGNRSGASEIVSPLVDIRSRLVNQAETELFTVQATAPSYWRVSALPEFDGDRWDLPDGGIDDETDGTLSAPLTGAVTNDQAVTITGLRGGLVPSAPEPVSASGPGAHYNALTASLLKSGSALREGDVYVVRSAMPRFGADALRSATSAAPPDPMFTALPDGLPPEIAATAASVTGAAPTPFDRMVMLQDWFRNNFTYDTNVPEGSGASAIMSFLENRIGYCEQFAGTFAAMARLLGLPARVAVGFTQGDPGSAGAFVVRGRNAHAWPEIWFDGFGWVPFEPTPGRGMPGAEAYTGVPPQQAGDPPDPGTTTTTTTTTTVAESQAQQGAAPAPTTVPPASTQSPPPAQDSSDSGGWRLPWLPVLVVVVLVALAVVSPTLVRAWRRRRSTPSGDHAQVLLGLWDRALDALSAIGFRASPALTPLEVSASAATSFPSIAAPLERLATAATTASYATVDEVAGVATPSGSGGGHDSPHDWCAYIETAVENSLTVRERIKRHFTVWH